jgi:3-hydroxy-9,10-secoandrosta-1,3,5(10)-triene-9,17-dione monooxygenase reductase component
LGKSGDMNSRISSPKQGNRGPVLRGVAIDPKQFRSVMGTFATGVAVITTEWSGELFGATINSLTSVSLEHCMLCTSKGSATGAAIRNRGFFSVNILGQHQSELSARFTGNQQTRFEDLAVAFSADGLPLLQGAAAQLCCRVAAVHKAGDHDIILGEVFSGEEIACRPLVFHKGAYGVFSVSDPNEISNNRKRYRGRNLVI